MEPTGEVKTQYVPHAGTVKVSGRSEAIKLAKYALMLVSKGTTPVDFLFIGANAGQQAYKACSITASLMLKHQKIQLSFIPLRFLTDSPERDVLGRAVEKDGVAAMQVKDAFVWRVVTSEAKP